MGKNIQRENTCLKIVLFGPECTGKTTLAKLLANHYKSKWVPEFAREYLQAMIDRYDGDIEAALIAYNAGAGNADKFIAAGRECFFSKNI